MNIENKLRKWTQAHPYKALAGFTIIMFGIGLSIPLAGRAQMIYEKSKLGRNSPDYTQLVIRQSALEGEEYEGTILKDNEMGKEYLLNYDAQNNIQVIPYNNQLNERVD